MIAPREPPSAGERSNTGGGVIQTSCADPEAADVQTGKVDLRQRPELPVPTTHTDTPFPRADEIAPALM